MRFCITALTFSTSLLILGRPDGFPLEPETLARRKIIIRL
jgi:hypothetical protein